MVYFFPLSILTEEIYLTRQTWRREHSYKLRCLCCVVRSKKPDPP